jgi:RNA polymerase sigma-70 factor (ECF subfamily)
MEVSAAEYKADLLERHGGSPGPADDVILRRVNAGDCDALVTLYDRYEDVVRRFALQMSGNQAIADDVTQETFLWLTRGARRYDSRQARFSTYLYGVVRHLTRRRMVRERTFEPMPGGSPERWMAPGPLIEHSLVEAATKREIVERVRRAVCSLPPRYRDPIVLCDLHGLGYAEAAAAAGCAVGTVRSRLSRARALLRRKLEGR